MRQASWGPRARRPRWIALVLVLLLTTTACSPTLARQPAAVSTKAPLELAVWVGTSPTPTWSSAAWAISSVSMSKPVVMAGNDFTNRRVMTR